ncbi:MAG: hypothetical protein Q9170_002027 [Blastenia crenularia]
MPDPEVTESQSISASEFEFDLDRYTPKSPFGNEYASIDDIWMLVFARNYIHESWEKIAQVMTAAMNMIWEKSCIKLRLGSGSLVEVRSVSVEEVQEQYELCKHVAQTIGILAGGKDKAVDCDDLLVQLYVRYNLCGMFYDRYLAGNEENNGRVYKLV